MICSERQLFHLFHRYGASTRALAQYGPRPEDYEARLERHIGEIWPDDLPRIFRNPGCSLHSHYLITIHPGEVYRGKLEKKFASRRVFDMVWERHLADRVDLMEELYNLFLAAPITAISAGWVFENRMHQLLRTERTLQLFPILPRRARTNIIFDDYAASKARIDPIEFQLTCSEEHPLIEGAELVMNHYYRLESSDFAAVDSVLLIHPPGDPPILFMFHVTRDETKHSTNLGGLRKIGELGVPLGTRRYLVIVTPESIHPSITVPLKYFGGTVQTVQSEETDSDESEDIGEDQDEEMDEDQGEEMGKGQDDIMGGAERVLFRAFHCPINMDRLFIPKIEFALGRGNRR